MTAQTNRTPTADVHRARWQFSLGGLLGLMLCVAMLSGLWNIAPQLAVLAAGTAPPFWLIWRLAYAIRRHARWRWLALGLALFYRFPTWSASGQRWHSRKHGRTSIRSSTRFAGRWKNYASATLFSAR